jgi:hypothetical protein
LFNVLADPFTTGLSTQENSLCSLKYGAESDLNEAWQIAERGPMRLNLADIHLHRARLFRDKEELQKACVMIKHCGYWRRKDELEDANAAAMKW